MVASRDWPLITKSWLMDIRPSIRDSKKYSAVDNDISAMSLPTSSGSGTSLS